MKKIDRILKQDSRYKRWQKPLEAAYICQTARETASHQFEVVSFKNGLLTLAVDSPAQAANLHAESSAIIDKINEKIGKRVVERIRFKIN